MAFETINDGKQLIIASVLASFIQGSKARIEEDIQEVTNKSKEEIQTRLDELDKKCRMHLKIYYEIAVKEFNSYYHNPSGLSIKYFLEHGLDLFFNKHVSLWKKHHELLDDNLIVSLLKIAIVFLFKIANVSFEKKMGQVVTILKQYPTLEGFDKNKALARLSMLVATAVYEKL